MTCGGPEYVAATTILMEWQYPTGSMPLLTPTTDNDMWRSRVCSRYYNIDGVAVSYREHALAYPPQTMTCGGPEYVAATTILMEWQYPTGSMPYSLPQPQTMTCGGPEYVAATTILMEWQYPTGSMPLLTPTTDNDMWRSRVCSRYYNIDGVAVSYREHALAYPNHRQ